MPRQVSHVAVMVHPMFAPYIWKPGVIPSHEGYSSKKILRQAKGEDPVALSQLQRLDLMYRFYRRQIDSVNKTPGAVLVFVKGLYGRPEEDVRHFIARGVPPKSADRLVDNSRQYQKMLEAYARKLMGKRVIVSSPHITNLSRPALEFQIAIGRRRFSMHPDTEVLVLGEYSHACVASVRDGFALAGFKAKIDWSKSLHVP